MNGHCDECRRPIIIPSHLSEPWMCDRCAFPDRAVESGIRSQRLRNRYLTEGS